MPGPRRACFVVGWLFAAVGLAWAVALSGCRPPTPPLEIVVAAKNSAEFNHWRYRHAQEVRGEIEQEFNYALQQLRYGVMAVELGLAPAEIDRRVQATIHGRTVREVIVAGYVIERRRVRDAALGEERVLDFQHEQLRRGDMREEDVDLLMSHMEQVRTRQSEKLGRLHEVDARLTALTGQSADDVEKAHKIRPSLPAGTAF